MKNCKALADGLQKNGLELVTGGTDCHMLLANVKKPRGVDGERVAKLFDTFNISLNKNTVPGDKSAIVPSGIRLGTHSMTTRGFVEKDFYEVANFINRGIDLVAAVKKECGGPKLLDFNRWIKKNAGSDDRIVKLKKEVTDFCNQFPYVD
mmetsp:Transcript_28862/g.40616  ORF Transcript_28862/g.40616 Transcript_28862/m.40616 type:complete len:150 (-) Transcript_28862:43-492(-)